MPSVKLTLDIDDGINEPQRAEVLVVPKDGATDFNIYAACNAAMEEMRERTKRTHHKALSAKEEQPA
jgi:hypothetical protein